MVTGEPARQGDGDAWSFHARLLAFVRPGRRFTLVPEGWKVSSTATPLGSDFQGYLAAALRYPTGLLRGPAELVLPLMAARDGLRLTESYGKFRKPDKRKEG
jgi:hypothetical protein